MFLARLTVYPEVPPEQGGGFLPTSFRDLLQIPVTLPGLDPAWTHTLLDVSVAGDRSRAELTVRSEPPHAQPVDRAIRVAIWQPAARVKFHDEAGTELVATSMNAPVRDGEHVELGGVRHRVVRAHWPLRHPETGVCRGEIDWQHVTVAPEPYPVSHPVAAG